MPCERYVNAIGELVDGTLGPLRRAELELHLESCEDCAALVADLREISRAAQSLGDLQPPPRVWTQIAGQLRSEGRAATPARSVFTRSSRIALALAAMLVLAVGASLMLLLPRGAAAPPAAEQAADSHAEPAGNGAGDQIVQAVAPGVSTELELTQRHFENAIEEARKAGGVDPKTVAVLQENFLVMNDAIEKSRKALVTDPQNTAARTSFYELLKQKIQFLQNTIALLNEMRQGDAAGAAQIVEGGKS